MNTKEKMLEEISKEMENKERELKESKKEIAIFEVKIKVDKKAMEMENVGDELKEEFKYSVMALENMLVMEENRKMEIEKELEVLKFRKETIESQFSDNELTQ